MAELGTKLGKYEIIREIARSNDIVYEAYDDATNRRIALKELQVPVGASASQAEERRQRFLREARAAGALSHPAIVTIHEVGEDAGRCFIAMEFLDGYTLRDRIDAEGFLLRDEAIRIATEIAGALAFAHRHGVIHRDVKPENIQILSDGRVKLTDFGIARLSYEPNITVDGQVFGTPAYMSPEQIAGRHLDPRTDLFSLGVVLYEMLCGQKPFGGDSVLAISVAVSTQPLKQIPGVPTAVMQVLEKALQKRPEARFHDLEEFIQALRGAALSPATPAVPVLPMTVVTGPVASRPPVRRLRVPRLAMWLGGCAGAILLVRLLLWPSQAGVLADAVVDPTAAGSDRILSSEPPATKSAEEAMKFRQSHGNVPTENKDKSKGTVAPLKSGSERDPIKDAGAGSVPQDEPGQGGPGDGGTIEGSGSGGGTTGGSTTNGGGGEQPGRVPPNPPE
ncbi:MAG TPA: serine/threonine-protein kinase [Fimbriimonadaceae bacterium]|nr:serine/threonine-protein kinase [Fimbriimonadaceae bacterium]